MLPDVTVGLSDRKASLEMGQLSIFFTLLCRSQKFQNLDDTISEIFIFFN